MLFFCFLFLDAGAFRGRWVGAGESWKRRGRLPSASVARALHAPEQVTLSSAPGSGASLVCDLPNTLSFEGDLQPVSHSSI